MNLAEDLELWIGEEGPLIEIDGLEISTPAALVARCPGLLQSPGDLARALNHLARGARYRLVATPEEARASVAAASGADLGLPALALGKPDLSAVSGPEIVEARLVHFAADPMLRLLYRAEHDLDGGSATYAPVPPLSGRRGDIR